MSDWPRNYVVPTHIHTLSRQAGGLAARHANVASGGPTPSSWVNNLACYVPLYLPWPYNVRRMFWVNGSPPTGNLDVGLYSASGTRIYSSGSIAAAGAANTPQYVTPSSDILLAPGAYFMALAYNSSTSFALYSIGWGSLGPGEAGVYAQSSAFPLPALATFARWTFNIIALIGITNTDSGF